MSNAAKPIVVIPADHPTQISDSAHLERLREIVDLRIFHDFPDSCDEQLRRAKDASIIINSRGNLHWTADLLSALPKLRMMTTVSIGTDAVDLVAARNQGLVVCNVPGRTAHIVAEHALALLLAAARQLAFQTAELRAGRWTAQQNTLISGKTLGIVGTGSIGTAMIQLGKAIGMTVLAWTFHPSEQRAKDLDVKFVELPELLRSSDAVSIHVKLTPDSRHLIGTEELALMKRGSILVNTARGPVVDTGALVEALNSRHLAAAGLDVFDQEPLPADSPILSCEQVVLSPHSADQMPEGIDLLNCGAIDNVLAFLEGSPKNVVT